MGVKSWSDNVAAFVVDALVEARLVGRDDIESATAITSEEIFVRLYLLDYPPAEESDLSASEVPKENDLKPTEGNLS